MDGKKIFTKKKRVPTKKVSYEEEKEDDQSEASSIQSQADDDEETSGGEEVRLLSMAGGRDRQYESHFYSIPKYSAGNEPSRPCWCKHLREIRIFTTVDENTGDDSNPIEVPSESVHVELAERVSGRISDTTSGHNSRHYLATLRGAVSPEPRPWTLQNNIRQVSSDDPSDLGGHSYQYGTYAGQGDKSVDDEKKV